MGTCLFLVGFMGSGKTTLGPILATKLGLPFVDLDARIVLESGRSIPVLFARDGEAHFRRLEHQALTDLSSPALVALGAGAFAYRDNRIRCRELGFSLFLDWPHRVLTGRIHHDGSRPLWSTPAQVKRLFLRRRVAYRACDITWRPKPPFYGDLCTTVREVMALLDLKLPSHLWPQRQEPPQPGIRGQPLGPSRNTKPADCRPVRRPMENGQDHQNEG